jgi:hypothetical protein
MGGCLEREVMKIHEVREAHETSRCDSGFACFALPPQALRDASSLRVPNAPALCPNGLTGRKGQSTMLIVEYNILTDGSAEI